jgi:hypothetical protein
VADALAYAQASATLDVVSTASVFPSALPEAHGTSHTDKPLQRGFLADGLVLRQSPDLLL